MVLIWSLGIALSLNCFGPSLMACQERQVRNHDLNVVNYASILTDTPQRRGRNKVGPQANCPYASVKGNLELPLLKGRRRFDVETTSNLEVYIFRGW